MLMRRHFFSEQKGRVVAPGQPAALDLFPGAALASGAPPVDGMATELGSISAEGRDRQYSTRLSDKVTCNLLASRASPSATCARFPTHPNVRLIPDTVARTILP